MVLPQGSPTTGSFVGGFGGGTSYGVPAGYETRGNTTSCQTSMIRGFECYEGRRQACTEHSCKNLMFHRKPSKQHIFTLVSSLAFSIYLSHSFIFHNFFLFLFFFYFWLVCLLVSAVTETFLLNYLDSPEAGVLR